MITSPYNFVPLSEKVVMPYWAKQVSHDIPFKDSHSGSLSLKIKAESEVYVRNGVPKDGSNDERNRFNNYGNRHFIPGSSLRGMLRSVVEIMSFGRMKNKVDDVKYSVRDFQNNALYPKTEISNHVECGWLYQINGEYFLDECGKPGRISHKNLDVLCAGNKISEYYKDSNNIKNDNAKSAKSKYDKFPFEKEGHRFKDDYISVGRQVFKIDEEVGEEGTIVLTGQPGPRKEPKEGKASGKHLEFIFWHKNATETPVPENVVKNFLFAYYDHDKNSQKADWKWRKKQLETGEKVPVFFRKTKGEITDMGLTMLFKVTYKNSVLDLIHNTQKDTDAPDLAELIFGFVNGDQSALKGRVQVGHAFVSSGKAETQEVKQEILGGPKASYYPNYIEQKTNPDGKVAQYRTFMDGDARIRGWKRYPIRAGQVKSYPKPTKPDGTVNPDVVTEFIPLAAGSEFTFDLHYHNLRKEELGALISAITFHNTKGLYHSVGSAKPLGYGKISLSIEDGLSPEEQLQLLKEYETYMDVALGHITPQWSQSPQVKELLAMARPSDDDRLEYMALKGFAEGKKGRDVLLNYAALSQSDLHPKPLATNQELTDAADHYIKESRHYQSLKSPEELKRQMISEKEMEMENVLRKRKEELLRNLEERATQIQTEEDAAAAAEDQKRKEEEEATRARERQARASAGLPERWNTAMGFDRLAKEVPQWLKKLDQNQVPGKFQYDFSALVTEIIRSELASTAGRKLWQNENKRKINLDKIAKWVSAEEVEKIKDTLF